MEEKKVTTNNLAYYTVEDLKQQHNKYVEYVTSEEFMKQHPEHVEYITSEKFKKDQSDYLKYLDSEEAKEIITRIPKYVPEPLPEFKPTDLSTINFDKEFKTLNKTIAKCSKSFERLIQAIAESKSHSIFRIMFGE